MPQLDATFGQYLFNLVFYLFLCLVSFYLANKQKDVLFLWVLTVLFCIFSYFAGDWFHYRLLLPYLDQSFSEPVYYYFAELSGRNYLFFRLLVWGLATLFLFVACKRLKLNGNIAAFVYIWFFLPTFCYARASLAMASYFCGLSFFIEKSHRRLPLIDISLGLFLIVLSYFFHRSFLPIIVATPLIFVKFNRGTIVLILLLFPFFLALLRYSLNQMAADMFLEGSDFESFSDAAQGYAMQERRTYNWKYSLVSNLKYIGFYLPILYVIIRAKFSSKRIALPFSYEKIISVAILILVLSTAFFVISYTDNTSQVMGYRYLYMLGIPSTFLLSYLLQMRLVTKKKSLILMSLAWLSTVLLIVGKLFALS